MPERDTSLGKIVWRELQRYFISGEHPDAITAEPAGQMGQYNAVVFELDTEQAAGELFQHGASYFDTVFFTHTPRISTRASESVAGPRNSSGGGDVGCLQTLGPFRHLELHL